MSNFRKNSEKVGFLLLQTGSTIRRKDGTNVAQFGLNQSKTCQIQIQSSWGDQPFSHSSDQELPFCSETNKKDEGIGNLL